MEVRFRVTRRRIGTVVGALALVATGVALGLTSNAYTDAQGAYHGWDRLTVPFTTVDPFANEGSYVRPGSLPPGRFVPDVENAYDSRERVARFFRRKL